LYLLSLFYIALLDDHVHVADEAGRLRIILFVSPTHIDASYCNEQASGDWAITLVIPFAL